MNDSQWGQGSGARPGQAFCQQYGFNQPGRPGCSHWVTARGGINAWEIQVLIKCLQGLITRLDLLLEQDL